MPSRRCPGATGYEVLLPRRHPERLLAQRRPGVMDEHDHRALTTSCAIWPSSPGRAAAVVRRTIPRRTPPPTARRRDGGVPGELAPLIAVGGPAMKIIDLKTYVVGNPWKN